jgi:biopolymer transport protein ExbD
MSTSAPSRAIRRPAGDSGTFKPQLTSLVDVMTILLIFLLKSFSVETQLVTPAPDLTLPESTSREQVAPAINVAVTRTGVIVDGRQILTLAELAATPDDEPTVALLESELRMLAPYTGDQDTDRALTLQCDRDLDFTLLKRVMRTCSAAGFADFALLVQREAA